MRKKIILLGLLLTLGLIAISSLVSATGTCTQAFINDQALSNSATITKTATTRFSINITNSPTNNGSQNTTQVFWNFTTSGSNLFTAAINTSGGGSGAGGKYNVTADASDVADGIYTIRIYTFNSTNATMCTTLTYTGIIIDNANINGTLEAVSPAAGLTTSDNQTFKTISVGGQQINKARLYMGTTIFDMTLSGVNSTIASISPTEEQIPEGSYRWYVILDDTDGSTTWRSETRNIEFDYAAPVKSVPPSYINALQLNSLNLGGIFKNNTAMLIAVIIAVYFIISRKKK